MNILFMGTPDFSVRTLERLYEAGHNIVAVVTQPDKVRGRGTKVSYTPVKEKALELGLDVLQPRRVKDPEFMDILSTMTVDVIVVVAFGQILPKSVLEYPKYGCINIHASLLPKYRGAAPIQWAVIDGQKKTGVATMQMDEGLDTGDIIDLVEIPIDDKETGGSLFDKLMELGGELILTTLNKVEQGTATFTKQNDAESTYAKMLTKELGNLDFTKNSKELECLIRGLNPWPSAYTHIDGKTLKIWEADVTTTSEKLAPGTIFNVTKSSFNIATGDGALKINEVQLEGKKRMSTGDFLRGYHLEPGTVLE